jgi:hypothetical protein
MAGSGGAAVRRVSEARLWRVAAELGARVLWMRGVGCGLGRARAHDGALNRGGYGLGVRARGPSHDGGRRAGGGLSLEPESGSRSGTTLMGGPQLSAEERGEGEGYGRTGPRERENELGARGKRGGKKGRLGWVVRERGESRLGWAATRKRKRKKREKEKWAGSN